MNFDDKKTIKKSDISIKIYDKKKSPKNNANKQKEDSIYLSDNSLDIENSLKQLFKSEENALENSLDSFDIKLNSFDK